MNLPRWTAYLALAILAVGLFTAIPSRRKNPLEGAARAAREGAPVDTTYERFVVLGIDGMDPDILAEVIERYPDRMQNFRRLIEQGSGIRELGTSMPPQSPVAWSNFITGRNPGGHGIFDFIHRDPEDYSVLPGTVTGGRADSVWLPGQWKFPTQEGGDSNRTGEAFWTTLGKHGVPADVWRMPINFPVEPSAKGVSFPGMMTPAVDSAYGEPSFYSTDPPVESLDQEKVINLGSIRGGVAHTYLLGPNNSFKDGDPRTQIPLDIYIDEEANAIALEVGGSSLVLEPGEWSTFVPVSFSMLPMGLMDVSGIVRFYVRSVTPELELYASPVNVDPTAPISPVSAPDSASADLAEAIGLYYTQGMAEDVNGLKNRMLTDAEFMAQAQLVFNERDKMLDFALENYMAREDGGLLFFYYSAVDLCSHMMWRHSDPKHPFHDEELAQEDSSWWSEREGSTWKDVVSDLYLKMDPVLGRIRERVGEDTLIMVMSDHGFAPYRRKFSLNTWLLENGYLVLNEGQQRELPVDDAAHAPVFLASAVDWSQTRAYGMGFNGLYLNLAGREGQGSLDPADAPALLAELKSKLEALIDTDGTPVVLSAPLATDIYQGERLAEAPDILVGYNQGYGNSDEASKGRITADVLIDNDRPGTFNGSHLMDPSVVGGILITNRGLAVNDPQLIDITTTILKRYGVDPDESMRGRPVLR